MEYIEDNIYDSTKRKIAEGTAVKKNCGYDIVSDLFFVNVTETYIDESEIECTNNIALNFKNFNSYFNFLDGNIYNNSCYRFIPKRRLEEISEKVDSNRILTLSIPLRTDTIDMYSFDLCLPDNRAIHKEEQYKIVESVCDIYESWIKAINECKTGTDLQRVIIQYSAYCRQYQYENDIDSTRVNVFTYETFLLWNYIYTDISDMARFKAVTDYISNANWNMDHIATALCILYDPEQVLELCHCPEHYSKNTKYKFKRRIKDYIAAMQSGTYEQKVHCYFDERTHYYCIATGLEYDKYITADRYFKSFDDFIAYRKGDLRNTDLSGALYLDVDISKYIIDETTKLPLHLYTEKDLTYGIEKKYDDGWFSVIQTWTNSYNQIIKTDKHYFGRFFDFVAFLKGNLSNADLLACDGLSNLEEWDDIDFSNAKMSSTLCSKLGMACDEYKINRTLLHSFEETKHNEEQTALVLQENQCLEIQTDTDYEEQRNFNRVYYVSDIHLLHKLDRANCKSKNDVINVLQKVANNLVSRGSYGDLLLINGDTASDFELFQIFIEILYKTLKPDRNGKLDRTVIFTLGNHELWSFPDLLIDKIIEKYRSLLENYGMYLIHNEIMYKDGEFGIHKISYDDLLNMEISVLNTILTSTRWIILGGIGFSGQNTEFNACTGIYRNIIDRETEILESSKFEQLYDKLYPILKRKNSIVMTHMPKDNWHSNSEYDLNIIYISGHTHQNYFYDDGEIRIYADNQSGYDEKNVHLRSFLIDRGYDCFDDYEDGIYEITTDQYEDFYRGQNELSSSLGWGPYKLYLLKKNRYHCFIHESKTGSKTILNGSSRKKIPSNSLEYYYEHMDKVIKTIKGPYDKYFEFQTHIANTIKQIGGYGNIHGCIIDIDFYNHIYVNPFDLSVTGYWAADMIDKLVFSSVPALLKKNCPIFYANYTRMLQDNEINLPVLVEQTTVSTKPVAYLSTDIYKASRQINKLQKLSSNVLTFWPDNDEQILLTDNVVMIEEK